MNVNFENFIGIFTDVFPDGFCERTINSTEKAIQAGVGYNRLTSENSPKHNKEDFAVNGLFLENVDSVQPSLRSIYRDSLQNCFQKYIEEYSVLTQVHLNSFDMKIQKSSKGQGYHVWHFEQGKEENMARALFYIVYLNSLSPEEGGETEFLYLQKRVRPEKNKIIISPAAFTHAHRGNPILSNNYKYIITGWFNII